MLRPLNRAITRHVATTHKYFVGSMARVPRTSPDVRAVQARWLGFHFRLRFLRLGSWGFPSTIFKIPLVHHMNFNHQSYWMNTLVHMSTHRRVCLKLHRWSSRTSSPPLTWVDRILVFILDEYSSVTFFFFFMYRQFWIVFYRARRELDRFRISNFFFFFFSTS